MTSTNFTLKPADGTSIVEVVDTILIGKSADCDLQLASRGVSRKHAQVWIDAGKMWIKDLQSTNGTFVNDQRITDPQSLTDGDQIRLDKHVFSAALGSGNEQSTVFREAPVATVVTPAPASVDAPAPSPDIEKSDPPVAPAPVASEKPSADSASEPTVQTEQIAPEPVPDQNADSKPAGTTADDLPGDWQPSNHTQMLSPEELQKKLMDARSAPARPGEVATPFLQVTAGGTGSWELIGTDNRWRVGRNSDCEIVIDDEYVSEYHATLKFDNGRWKLSDEGSAAGTWVNEAKTNTAFLDDGDRLQFGPVKCVFWLPAQKKHRKSGPRLWVAAAIAAVTAALLVVGYLVF